MIGTFRTAKTCLAEDECRQEFFTKAQELAKVSSCDIAQGKEVIFHFFLKKILAFLYNYYFNFLKKSSVSSSRFLFF